MDNLDKLIKEAEKEFKIEFVNYGELIGEGLCIHKTKGLIFIAKYIRKAYNLGRLEERKIYHEEIQEKLKSVPMDKKTKKLLKNL